MVFKKHPCGSNHSRIVKCFNVLTVEDLAQIIEEVNTIKCRDPL
jgi:hypothetical protein